MHRSLFCLPMYARYEIIHTRSLPLVLHVVSTSRCDVILILYHVRAIFAPTFDRLARSGLESNLEFSDQRTPSYPHGLDELHY